MNKNKFIFGILSNIDNGLFLLQPVYWNPCSLCKKEIGTEIFWLEDWESIGRPSDLVKISIMLIGTPSTSKHVNSPIY